MCDLPFASLQRLGRLEVILLFSRDLNLYRLEPWRKTRPISSYPYSKRTPCLSTCDKATMISEQVLFREFRFLHHLREYYLKKFLIGASGLSLVVVENC